MLATCFRVFDDKCVRFFTGSSMEDVGIPQNEKDEVNAALSKFPTPCNMNTCGYHRIVWSVCHYIINGMNDNIMATDLFVGLEKSYIKVDKLDFYTIRVEFTATNKNITKHGVINFETWDTWFIPKLMTFVKRILDGRMFDDECFYN